MLGNWSDESLGCRFDSTTFREGKYGLIIRLVSFLRSVGRPKGLDTPDAIRQRDAIF